MDEHCSYAVRAGLGHGILWPGNNNDIYTDLVPEILRSRRSAHVDNSAGCWSPGRPYGDAMFTRGQIRTTGLELISDIMKSVRRFSDLLDMTAVRGMFVVMVAYVDPLCQHRLFVNCHIYDAFTVTRYSLCPGTGLIAVTYID